jgi:hypothetical protein
VVAGGVVIFGETTFAVFRAGAAVLIIVSETFSEPELQLSPPQRSDGPVRKGTGGSPRVSGTINAPHWARSQTIMMPQTSSRYRCRFARLQHCEHHLKPAAQCNGLKC